MGFYFKSIKSLSATVLFQCISGVRTGGPCGKCGLKLTLLVREQVFLLHNESKINAQLGIALEISFDKDFRKVT